MVSSWNKCLSLNIGYMLDEKGTDDAECSRKVVNVRKVAGAIKSLVNVKGLRLECARVLHEGMLLPVLLYSSETMVWNKKYLSLIHISEPTRLLSISYAVFCLKKKKNKYYDEVRST